VRNIKDIRSYKDAQGFRKIDGTKLNVKKIDAFIYHYGWVKPPKAQQEKQKNFHKMWHDDEWMKKNISQADEFDYSKIDYLIPFTENHPAVMLKRVNELNWEFKYDKTKIKSTFKIKFLVFIENLTGWRVGEYKNYKVLRI
jgi:hypothetical protein